MRFTIYFVLRGPARTIKAPNAQNPVEAESLMDVLQQLVRYGDRLPAPAGCECIGVEVRPCDELIEDMS